MDGYAIAPSFSEFQLGRQSYGCGVVLFLLKLGFSGFPFFKT